MEECSEEGGGAVQSPAESCADASSKRHIDTRVTILLLFTFRFPGCGMQDEGPPLAGVITVSKSARRGYSEKGVQKKKIFFFLGK